MKLLDKKSIVEQKNSDRKREIEEGVKLARSIDSLRETHTKEQLGLKKFRDASLEAIKQEIQTFLVKKEALVEEVKELEHKRRTVLAPIDLKREWKKIDEDKNEIQLQKKLIYDQEGNIVHKEIANKAKEKELFEKEEVLAERENLTNRYIAEANINYDRSENLKTEIQTIKDNLLKEVASRENEFKTKELSLSLRERDLQLGKDQVEKDKQVIEKEKLHIASQQETLRKAWINIKKIKK